MPCIENIVKYRFYHHLQLKIQQTHESPELKDYPSNVTKKYLKLGNPPIVLAYIAVAKLGS